MDKRVWLCIPVLIFLASPLAAEQAKTQEDDSDKGSPQFLIEQLPVPPPPVPARYFPGGIFRPPPKIETPPKIPSPPSPPALAGRIRPATQQTDAPLLPKAVEPLQFAAPALVPESETAPASAALPDASFPPVELKPKVFSLRRAPTPASRTTSAVTVVTEEQIRKMPVRDPGEVLSYFSGIDVDPRTKFGHYRPLSIYGSASRHVRVMVDGIPFNTQLSGQADILPALPVENIRQIEVLKGAASSAWGSALGGAVNVITKDPLDFKEPHRMLKAAFSEYSAAQIGGEWAGRAGPVAYYVSGNHADAGGARSIGNTVSREDTLQKKFFGKWQAPVTDELLSTVSFGYSGSDVNEGVLHDFPLRTQMPYYARYGQARLDFDPDERGHWEAAFKVNRQSIQSDTLFFPSDTLLSSARSRDHYYGLALKGVGDFGDAGSLVGGLDVDSNFIKSTLMDEGRSVVLAAPYANVERRTGPVTWAGGIRYDLNREYGGEWGPSAGAVWELPYIERTRVRVNAAHGFNAPPLLWKYFEETAPGLTVNNPNLRPERGWTYQTGIETEYWEKVRINLTGYRSDITDAIATVMTPEGRFMKDNFSKFRQTGFEFESEWKPVEWAHLSFAAFYNEPENRANGQDVRGRGVVRPGYRLGGAFELPFGLEAGVWGSYNRWDSIIAAQPNDRKFMWDGRLSKEITLFGRAKTTLFVNIFNLTNSKYWSNINFPHPERYFEGGFSVEF